MARCSVDAKQAARERLSATRKSLLELSRRIHAHPELGFEEEKACGWLAEVLDQAGFAVKTGVCDLPTAFSATAGHGPLNIGIMAEYDSLPGVGHACGHNLIAAMTVGAALAAAKVADDAGLTITVLGTPAEEIGNAGGKVLMLERGAFKGLHAAMMVHPAPMDMLQPKIIAASMFDVHYTGKEAHASAFPELGINAADALTIAQTSIGLLRQHIRQTDRIHGICTHGGDAPNIVPAYTSARYIIRGETVQAMEELRVKVRRCFEAGALATGSKLEIKGGDKPYAEMRHDADMAEIYRRNAEALGRSFDIPAKARAFVTPETAARFSASTDMGNVSLLLPAIHPMIGIDSFPAVNHQPEFTAHCVSPAADQALWDGALAMAWTMMDMATEPGLRQRLLARH
ncbi:MAG: M20 family metallopeptidase [Gammaproteobacteria bacterium]|nr:M20 family metallopeptidase [Gammaproteobacteria bacterium]